MRALLAALGLVKPLVNLARGLSDFIDPPTWPSPADRALMDAISHLSAIIPPPGATPPLLDAYMAGVGDSISILRERAGMEAFGPGEGLRAAVNHAYLSRGFSGE